MVKPFEIMDEDKRIVAGWASVEIVDSHGDIIPIEELKRGMITMMDRGGQILYGHTNKPVGKILAWEIRRHDEADADGLWIVAKIYKEYPLDDEVWRLIKEGKLLGFSIGAQGRKEKKVLKDKSKGDLPNEVNVIRDLNLMEISLVPTPANPLATIEEVNYVAKSLDVGQVSEKTVDVDEVLRRFKIDRDLYERVKDCGVCNDIIDIVKSVGDVEVGVRVWRALNVLRLNNTELAKSSHELDEKIKKLKEYERMLIESRSDDVEAMSSPIDLDEKLDFLWKSLVDIQKPFGKWDSFDDCVSDMRSKGYSEDSAKRICGSLQAKLEKVLDEIVEAQTSLIDFGFPKFPRGGWPRRRRQKGKQTKMTEYLSSLGNPVKAVAAGLDEICAFLEDAGDDYLPLLAVLDSVYDLVKRIDESGEVLKDKRPPKEWFDRCVERTGRPGLCGWVFYHHLYPKKPESKKEPDEPHTQAARARKRAWLGSG